jgi:hypothetical protein
MLRTVERRLDLTADKTGLSKLTVFRRWAKGEIPLLTGASIVAAPSLEESPDLEGPNDDNR